MNEQNVHALVDVIKLNVCLEAADVHLTKRAYTIAKGFGPGVHTVSVSPGVLPFGECHDSVFTYVFIIEPSWVCRIFCPARYHEARETIRNFREKNALAG